MAARSIHILQMGKHFLYLPIYFAENQDFFGFLPQGTKVIIDSCDKHTDVATYDQMMDESSRYRDFVMAITDPIQVFRTPLNSKRKPAVLATLVTNAAFWAVNHGKYEIASFRDLGVFERVIAYAPGTTSHNIAVRIARDSGNAKQTIEVVDVGNELLLLSDPQKGLNAVALSPDLLHIEEMISSGKATLELALGKTNEYNDVLVTTLVSYKEFVDQNEPIVRGIVMGIQKALLMTRENHPDIISFAQDYFHFAERASGAVEKAVAAGVFPLSVQVAQPHWENAAKANSEAIHAGGVWPNAEQKQAFDYYRECVQPYEKFTDSATRTVFSPPPEQPRQRASWNAASLFLAVITAIAITATMGALPAIIFAIAAIIAWAVINFSKHPTFLNWTLAIVFVLGVFMIVLPLVPKSDLEIGLWLPIGISFVLLSLVEYAKRAKH